MSISEPTAPGAILFDLDGTLIDSVPDITLAVNELLALDDLTPATESEIRGMVGRGLTVLVERVYGARAFQPAQFAERLEAMRGIYARHLIGHTVLMPGADQALRRLWQDGWRLAVVTNKLRSATETILEHFGIRSLFGAVVGDGSGHALKPAPDMLAAALAELGMSPATAYMVGDSAADMESSRRAGIASILVRGGYLSEPADTVGADIIIASLEDLPDTLAAARRRPFLARQSS